MRSEKRGTGTRVIAGNPHFLLGTNPERKPCESFLLMSWNPDMNRNTVDDIEELAYPPNGGRVNLVILGIIVPLVIVRFAGKAWIKQEATWLGL